MAIPQRNHDGLARVVYDGTDFWLIPYNAEGKDVLDSIYAGESASDGVTITQEDAGRGGLSQTDTDIKALKIALTTS